MGLPDYTQGKTQFVRYDEHHTTVIDTYLTEGVMYAYSGRGSLVYLALYFDNYVSPDLGTFYVAMEVDTNEVVRLSLFDAQRFKFFPGGAIFVPVSIPDYKSIVIQAAKTVEFQDSFKLNVYTGLGTDIRCYVRVTFGLYR